MKQLRQYIRTLFVESRFKQMSKKKITDLRAHLQNANFMNVDAGGDYDDSDYLGSEAQQVLIDELSDYFDEKFPPVGTINIEVRVDNMLTLPTEGADAVLKGASYYYDGLHNVSLILAQMDDGEPLSALGDVSKKVYEVVSHEMLHFMQFMKFSKGEPSMDKWAEFTRTYEEQNVGNQQQDYFFFDEDPSEMEAFAFQVANEVVSSLGKDEAMRALPTKRAQSISDLDTLSDASSSIRVMAGRQVDLTRPEFIEMLKRARQYAKRMD